MGFVFWLAILKIEEEERRESIETGFRLVYRKGQSLLFHFFFFVKEGKRKGHSGGGRLLFKVGH